MQDEKVSVALEIDVRLKSMYRYRALKVGIVDERKTARLS
jgi:hypothetical protein